MKKALLAMAAAVLAATNVFAGDYIITDYEYSLANYQNTGYAAQTAYDSFNANVTQRMATARLGASATRDSAGRVIDCNLTNGWTVWGGGYGGWADQKTRGFEDGYKYRVGGPALGADWSNGALTVGLAATYSWGKLKGREVNHDQKTRTWGLTGYAQWVKDCFYVNGTLGYARNRFTGDYSASIPYYDNYVYQGQNVNVYGGSKYHSNTWNVSVETGYKFKFRGFSVTPNVGLRYFHDKAKSFDDTLFGTLAGGVVLPPQTHYYSKDKYHVLELPLGVNLGYEIQAGKALIMPQFRFAYVPELDRKHGASSYTVAGDPAAITYKSYSPRRNKHAFIVGGGVQAKLNAMVSLNVDYYAKLRGKAHEHHLNAGFGVSF